MIRTLYSAGLALGLIGYLPVAALRRVRTGHRTHLRQRLGHIARDLPPGPRVWVHAVSVGEAITAVPLVEGIRRRWPELAVVLTTVTPTGARIVTERLADVATHRYFPIDLPGAVRRAIDAVQPRFFIGMETELWPNFLEALGRRGVPAMIANGRISDRSFRRYRRVRFVVRRMLDRLAVLAMQSDEDARRVIALGAPPERVVVTGSLKTDLAAGNEGARELWERLLGVERGDRLWIAGSTHRGEEAGVVAAHARLRQRHPRLRLILAPRHPERVPEVERVVREHGLEPLRRSALPRDRRPDAVIVIDTVGELAELYRLGDVVFVGGSLVPLGGHNMLEPALRGKPVLFGPHTANFRESAEALVAGGGARIVADAAELERAVGALLADPETARVMGEAAFRAVVARQGAVQATLALVERFLYPDNGRTGHGDR